MFGQVLRLDLDRYIPVVLCVEKELQGLDGFPEGAEMKVLDDSDHGEVNPQSPKRLDHFFSDGFLPSETPHSLLIENDRAGGIRVLSSGPGIRGKFRGKVTAGNQFNFISIQKIVIHPVMHDCDGFLIDRPFPGHFVIHPDRAGKHQRSAHPSNIGIAQELRFERLQIPG